MNKIEKFICRGGLALTAAVGIAVGYQALNPAGSRVDNQPKIEATPTPLAKKKPAGVGPIPELPIPTSTPVRIPVIDFYSDANFALHENIQSKYLSGAILEGQTNPSEVNQYQENVLLGPSHRYSLKVTNSYDSNKPNSNRPKSSEISGELSEEQFPNQSADQITRRFFLLSGLEERMVQWGKEYVIPMWIGGKHTQDKDLILYTNRRFRLLVQNLSN